MMMMMLDLLGVVLLANLLLCANGMGDVGPSEWKESDKIEVWLLSRPIHFHQDGVTIAQLNNMRYALGFVNKRNNVVQKRVEVQFNPLDSVSQTVFPSHNNTGKPVWQNGGAVGFLTVFDFNGWKNEKLLYEITGEIFMKFQCWLPIYEQQFPTFQLFQFKASIEDPVDWLPPSDYSSFVFVSLTVLWDLGALPIGSKPEDLTAELDYFYIFSEEPVHVNYETEKQHIDEFYQTFKNTPNATLESIIKNTIAKTGNKFYYYYQDSYVKTKLIYPYYNFESLSTKLVDHKRTPSKVQFEDGCVVPGGGANVGLILFLVIFFLIIIYCVAFTLYKAIRLNARGKDMIPHIELYEKCYRAVVSKKTRGPQEEGSPGESNSLLYQSF